jgi:Flp pilus assembly protein TadG
VERSTARAKRAIGRLRSETGQAFVISVVWMVALLGMAGLVVDVGSWYRSQRELQADADAAALAGAQELPDDTSTAGAQAQNYASKNGFSLAPGAISYSGVAVPNDSITVKVKRPAPTFFSKVFGINSVDVDVKATAKNSLLGSAKYVAPITVNIAHPMISGHNCPCFDVPTTLPLDKRGAPGAFGLLDLDNGKGNGASMLGNWILNGYDGFLPLGDYSSNTGAKFNSSNVQSALDARLNSVLMFPVYDTLTGNGTNATYHIIAWIGFYLTGYDMGGSSGELYGHFTEITWQGLPATANSGQPNLGARVVTLTG